jgi:hypothetical protein
MTYKSEALQALSVGWYIEADRRVLPTLTGYRIGVVGAILATREDAEALLSPDGENLRSRFPDARAVQVGDAWALMRRAAGEGLCGFQLFVQGEWSHRFMFMVRVEEAGTALPTVLTSLHHTSGWSESLTRTREALLEHAEVVHWRRFDVLDNVSGVAGQTVPFRNWKNGDPLFEIRSDGLVVLLAEVELIGHWNSTDGAFAFFTSQEEAQHYLTHHIGNGWNQIRPIGSQASMSAKDALASLRVRPVSDLKARLQDLARISPIAAWCINPDGHRENSGYGRLWFAGEHPARLAQKEGEETRMLAVSGIWRLDSANQFHLTESYAPWTGYDTIRWSGGPSLQLFPLDRSFGFAGSSGPIEPAGLTETELEEQVAEYLDSMSLDQSLGELHACSDDDLALDEFCFVSWDTVTGDGRESPWRFESVFGLLRHLAAYERDHDRHHRAAGATSCGHIGFVGSRDEVFEDVRSSRFQLGLRRLALRALREGYSPSLAADITTLCNGVLSTLHVEYAGYAKDLLWSSDAGQRKQLLEELGIPEEEWTDWEASADAHVDPEGRTAVVRAIGEEAWDTLEPRVRHFLATALLHLDRQGHAPQLDYAPVSLEIVKSLEVELGAIFEGFKQKLSGSTLAHDLEDREEANFAAFLNGTPNKKPPTLGAMSHFLRSSKSGASELMAAFQMFVSSLPNHAFLLDKKFCKDGLMKVTNKFRNGGVHDSAITEETCRDCVATLVGTQMAPGFIPKVASWKATSHRAR